MTIRLLKPDPEHEAWRRKFLARRRTEHAVCLSALVIFIVVGIWAMWIYL